MVDDFVRDANLNRYRDLDLDLTPHPVSGAITTLTGETAIRRALRNLVLTNYYDVPFNPNFGSSVNDLLFENVNSLTASNMEDTVTSLIDTFEPRVEVDDVSVVINSETLTAEITISFFIRSQPAPITETFIIQRNK